MSRFGTDGIRDLAGRGALAPAEVLRLGRVLGALARGRRVLVGRDTRASGRVIERQLVRGLLEQGASATLAGVLPTPGVARCIGGHALGVVISASHNPAEYNGIKLLDARGLKLPAAREEAIERRLDRPAPRRPAARRGTVRREAVAARYEGIVRGQLPGGLLAGWTVAVDAAHGATAGIFPRCLAHWGARVVRLGDRPDGRNINRGCGATDTRALRRSVLRHGARLGVAFDGDGDRCVFVDEHGQEQDGDAILYVLAKDLKARGAWPGRTVVATELANLGLDRAVRRLGGRVVRTPVGDRHVVATMRRGGFVLGGESSGHLIVPGSRFIGDGMMAAARVLGLLARSGRPLSALVRGLERFPQVSLNVPVSRKPPVPEVPGLARAVREGARALGREGRLVVRYSGTEPLLRILAEGPDRARLLAAASSVAEAAACLA